MTCSCNGILNNNESEWTTASHNIDELYKQNVEQKKPDIECMLSFYSYQFQQQSQ